MGQGIWPVWLATPAMPQPVNLDAVQGRVGTSLFNSHYLPTEPDAFRTVPFIGTVHAPVATLSPVTTNPAPPLPIANNLATYVFNKIPLLLILNSTYPYLPSILKETDFQPHAISYLPRASNTLSAKWSSTSMPRPSTGSQPPRQSTTTPAPPMAACLRKLQQPNGLPKRPYGPLAAS